MSTAAVRKPSALQAVEPDIEHSGPPSRRSRWLELMLRLTLRPMIAIWAAISALVVKFGPTGVEMWPIWTTLLRAADWGGFAQLPRGTEVEQVRLPACDAERVRAAGVQTGAPVVLYFHGGGYIACGLTSHRRLVARISKDAGAVVFNVGYRLLPRSAITDAVQDGVGAYRKLLEEGIAPERIVFAGDSAGGGLSFLVAVALKSEGLPMPAGIVGISPWTNLDASDKRQHRNARRDAVVPVKTIGFVVEQLIQKGDPLDERLSPVNLDLSGLPPTLIHVGTAEVLEIDALNIAQRLAAAGVPVTLKLWQGQIHDFHLIGLDVLPEARQAIREIGTFVQERTQ